MHNEFINLNRSPNKSNTHQCKEPSTPIRRHVGRATPKPQHTPPAPKHRHPHLCEHRTATEACSPHCMSGHRPAEAAGKHHGWTANHTHSPVLTQRAQHGKPTHPWIRTRHRTTHHQQHNFNGDGTRARVARVQTRPHRHIEHHRALDRGHKMPTITTRRRRIHLPLCVPDHNPAAMPLGHNRFENNAG